MTSDEIYDAGYAIPMYDIVQSIRHWRFREEEWSLPWNAVPLREIPGVGFYVAKIEDVRAAAEK